MCVCWDDFVITAHISSVTGLDNICSMIRLRRLSVLGHVERHDGTVPAWKALDLAFKTESVLPPNL